MTSELISQMPTKLVGIALLVAPCVQVFKRTHPDVRGWKALAVNLFLCTTATLGVGQDPAQIRTLNFWINVFVATLGASGVHSIGKGLNIAPGLFSLTPDQQDPLGWQCPHVENDAEGRPLSMCTGEPGQECAWATPGLHPRFHAERIALVTGGGPQMSEQTAAAAAEAANIAPLLSAPVPTSRATISIPDSWKPGGLYERELPETIRHMGMIYRPQPHYPVPTSRDTPKEPSTALAKVDSFAVGYPTQKASITTMAKSFFASLVSTAISKVESLTKAAFTGLIHSDAATKIEGAVQSFIKTDVGELAVDAVGYASTFVGQSNAELKAIALGKLKSDLTAAGHDATAIAESSLNLFLELAYTGTKGAVSQLSEALSKPAPVPDPAPAPVAQEAAPEAVAQAATV